MAEHVGPDRLHVLRGDVAAVAQEGVGLGRQVEVDGGARAAAVGDHPGQVLHPVGGGLAGGEDYVHDILFNLGVDIDGPHRVPGGQDVSRPDHLPGGGHGLGRHPVHDRQLFLLVRVAHDHLEHEAVHLGLGQRVGPLLLDRVLGGHHQEGLVERIGGVADGHLPLLHRLQQRALHLRRGAVDLVGQDQVREDRTLLGGELARLLVVDQGPDDVRGQQVRRELDALKLGADHVGESLDGQGLGQAGHALQQDVAVGQQRNQQPLQHPALAHDHLAGLAKDGVNKFRLLLHLLVDGLHVHGYLLP